MKTPNQLDELFHKRLGNYASEVPKGLWEKIEAQQPKRKRAGAWWQHKGALTALFVLLLASVAGVALWQNTAKILAFEELDAFPIHGKMAVVESETAQKEIKVEAAVAASTTTNQPQKSKIRNQPIDQNTRSKVGTRSSNFSSSSSRQAQDALDINDQKLVILNQNEAVATPELILVEKTRISNEQTTQQSKKVATLDALNQLKLTDLPLENTPPDPCYAFNPYDPSSLGPVRFYVDVLASPDFVNRRLDARNADAEGYAAVRDSVESSRFAFSTSVRLSMVLGNGTALRTGITYAQINEKLDLFDGTYTKSEIVEIEDAAGNIVAIDTVSVSGKRIKTTYNRFHLVDVPFIFGHEIRNKNFTVSINGGVFLNLYFRQKGELLDRNLEVVDFTSGAEEQANIFNNSVGMSFYGSMGLNYKIGHRMHLIAEPHLRYFSKSFTQESYDLKQNYWSAGVNLGIRVRL